MPRALLSVSDKTGITDLARGLAARGFELVSTGGTARALADAGLTVVNVSAVTGFPEMMDGRVKTLHPLVHGGILARRHEPDDLAAAAAHGIGLIDVVAVNLYPFSETARRPGVTFDELVEQIDIGGPSMVRAAAKNFRDVLVVVDPRRYAEVLSELARPGGPAASFRFALAQDAFAHTAAYDQAIAAKLARFVEVGGHFTEQAAPLPARLSFDLGKLRDLRYGENPHQKAALFEGLSPSFEPWTILQGKELSYTNLLDLDAAVRIVLEFTEPAAAVIKHTNPCGAATGASAADAYVRARDADSLAAFGGIVGLNRAIDRPAAEAIVSTFIEAVIAPEVEDEARPILARKANMRVVTTDFAALAAAGRANYAGAVADEELRSTLAGVLVQERDRVSEARQPWAPGALPDGVRVVTRRQPSAEEWEALRFAWRVGAHVKSNTVIFTDAKRTLAIGAGQMSRVDAVNVAVAKARGSAADPAKPLAGSVAASDAYFPFRDGLDAVAAAGATAVVQPGGSVRDPEVIAAADEHGLAMVFTGRRHFRH
jgi:phosphoribosylaminoimidazolecarboxamide formyltransferase/IMP cyclohydrolase